MLTYKRPLRQHGWDGNVSDITGLYSGSIRFSLKFMHMFGFLLATIQE